MFHSRKANAFPKSKLNILQHIINVQKLQRAARSLGSNIRAAFKGRRTNARLSGFLYFILPLIPIIVDHVIRAALSYS